MNSGEQSSVSVKLQAGERTETIETKTLSIGGGESVDISFEFEAKSEGSMNVIVSLLDEDGSYQDSWTGNVAVSREPSFKEGISSMFEDLITSFLDFIRSLFGG